MYVKILIFCFVLEILKFFIDVSDEFSVFEILVVLDGFIESC